MRLRIADRRAMAEVAAVDAAVPCAEATEGNRARARDQALQQAARRVLVLVEGECDPAAIPYVLRLAAQMASDGRGPGARHTAGRRGSDSP